MPDSNYDNPFSASPSTNVTPAPSKSAVAASPETKKGLDGAKWALVFVGILTIAMNIFLMVNASKEVEEIVGQQGGEDGALSSELLLTFVRAVYGGAVVLGVVFIVLGLLVYRFPIFCPLAGLILYGGSLAIFGILDPASLPRGIIVKIIVIVALFNAVRAGFAYRREVKEAYDRMFGASQPANG